MSTVDWLRTAIRDDLREPALPERTEPEWLDAALRAAIDDTGLSDRSMDLLVEAAAPIESKPRALRDVRAADPTVAARRVAAGMSTAQAAALIGVSPEIYESLEHSPLRWLNIPDVALVARFLGRLGIQPATFVRWLAVLRGNASGYAWGYRPGVAADGPAEAADSGMAHFLSWGEQLLREPTPSPLGMDEQSGRPE